MTDSKPVAVPKTLTETLPSVSWLEQMPKTPLATKARRIAMATAT